MYRRLCSWAAAANALCVVVALWGCGGENGASPREKCEALFEAFCESVGECYNERNDLEGSSLVRDFCVERIQASALCEGAVAVTSSYDQCLEGLHVLSCDELFDQDDQLRDDFNVPSNCRTVVQVRR